MYAEPTLNISSTENTLAEESLRRHGKYLPWPLHLIALSLKHMRLSKPHQELHILPAIFYLDLLQGQNSFKTCEFLRLERKFLTAFFWRIFIWYKVGSDIPSRNASIWRNFVITNYTTVQKSVFFKEIILLFSKGALYWLKVTVKTFVMLQKISISNKCCTFELSIHRRKKKKSK